MDRQELIKAYKKLRQNCFDRFPNCKHCIFVKWIDDEKGGRCEFENRDIPYFWPEVKNEKLPKKTDG